jgi:hypothetical protein
MEIVLKPSILILGMAVSGLPLQATQCGSALPTKGNALRAQSHTSAKAPYSRRKKKLPRSAGVIGCVVAPPSPKVPDISLGLLPPGLFLFQEEPPVLEQQSHK